MIDSYFIVPEAKHHRLAARYTRNAEGDLKIDTPAGQENPPTNFVSGGGQVRTTISDFYRYAQCLLNGGELDGVRILKEETGDQMLSPHVDAATFGGSSGDYGWALGGSIRTQVKPGDLGSVGTYTWNGGTGTYYWIDPTRGIVGILFAPVRPPFSLRSITSDFEEAVYRAIDNQVD
jgi:CubicO group peptidase (beta-lactamase class C family)